MVKNKKNPCDENFHTWAPLKSERHLNHHLLILPGSLIPPALQKGTIYPHGMGQVSVAVRSLAITTAMGPSL